MLPKLGLRRREPGFQRPEADPPVTDAVIGAMVDAIVAPADPEQVIFFGFHAQQATEKALKDWLALLGRKYPLVHDPGVLFQRLDAAGASTGFFRPLAHFTPFAAESATTGFPRTTVPWTAPRRSPWSAR